MMSYHVLTVDDSKNKWVVDHSLGWWIAGSNSIAFKHGETNIGIFSMLTW